MSMERKWSVVGYGQQDDQYLSVSGINRERKSIYHKASQEEAKHRPLEPTQIFRVYFVPARRAQPADSDFFSRRPLSRSPPGGFTS